MSWTDRYGVIYEGTAQQVFPIAWPDDADLHVDQELIEACGRLGIQFVDGLTNAVHPATLQIRKMREMLNPTSPENELEAKDECCRSVEQCDDCPCRELAEDPRHQDVVRDFEPDEVLVVVEVKIGREVYTDQAWVPVRHASNCAVGIASILAKKFDEK